MSKLQPRDPQVVVWVEVYNSKAALLTGLPQFLRLYCVKVFHQWPDVMNAIDTFCIDTLVICPSRNTSSADVAKRIARARGSCPEAKIILYGRTDRGDFADVPVSAFIATRNLRELAHAVVRPKVAQAA